MIVCLPHEANFLYFCNRMKALLLYRLFLAACFAVLLPYAAAGKQHMLQPVASYPVILSDSIPPGKPASRPDKKPSDKPEIKEVPKSRRQIKPAAVGEKIRIKPPVRIKPDMIKKPGKHIRRIISIP